MARDLDQAAASLPGDNWLAIEDLGADGAARKYRVMIIDGVLYPLHPAISADWKVHYFATGMEAHAAHREEERRFLDNMPGVPGDGGANRHRDRFPPMRGVDFLARQTVCAGQAGPATVRRAVKSASIRSPLRGSPPWFHMSPAA
nr:hypothetical protein [uncultured Rhodopila sp.]